jgi:hypothetical protein
MAIAYDDSVIHSRLDAITTRAGSAALLRIYDGTRPAKGGTATTLLAELTCGSPFAGSATGGELTANAISDDTDANATGTATWFRIVASNGTTFVMDGDVGTSGADLNLDSVSIVAGGTVSVTSFVITGGNA